MELIRRFLQRMQIDRPLAYALLSRVWQAAAGPITIALLVHFMAEDVRGIYYGLVSIVGIQAFFELGLLNVLISHGGHEAAAIKLSDEDTGADTAVSQPVARMKELIRASRRWFGVASILFTAIALGLGWYTFLRANVAVNWQLPLLVLIPSAAITVFLSPSLAIMEGAGFRDVIYRCRCFQMITGSIGVWLALLAGWNLWALVVSTLIQAAWTLYIVMVHGSPFFRRFSNVTEKPAAYSWARDVVPAQWRMAAIGAAYHLATQFFTVVVLWFHSATEAGQFGMTLSMTTAIQMLALSWVQTKYSVVALHHGSGEREMAGTLWRQTALVSTCLLITALTALIVLIAALPLLGRGYESAFITPAQLCILSVGCVANHLLATQGFYVLSRRANPLTISSVTGFLITAAAVWIAGFYYSTTGVACAYTATTALITLPLHTAEYLRFRSRTSTT